MSRTTQEQYVLNHLKYDKLTPLEALERYGIMHLASRVSDLKKRGYPIAKKMVIGSTGKRYAEYTMTAP